MNDRTGLGGENPRSRAETPLGGYQITPEEMRVLDECNWESFVRRSLPFGTILGLGAYTGVQRGFFRANARFGAGPKVTVAVIIGYFLGKISYQRECAEKLMALPNSRIGQLLRDVKEGKTASVPPLTMYGAKQEDIYSDAGPGSSLDIDSTRPVFSDDGPPPTDYMLDPEIPPSKKPLSYDDLRRKNRVQYSDARQNPYRIDPPASPEPFGVAPKSDDPLAPPPLVRSEPRLPRPKTNLYGDIVD